MLKIVSKTRYITSPNKYGFGDFLKSGGGKDMMNGIGAAGNTLINLSRSLANADTGSLLDKVGLANGGHLYAGGGNIAGAVSAGADMLSNAVQQAQIKDTSELEAGIKSHANQIVNSESNDDLLNDWNNRSTLKGISYKDLLNGGAGSAVMNALGSGMSGASSGASFGPIGAIVGGAAGLLSSGIGRIVARKKAKKQAKKINENVAVSNATNLQSFMNRAENLDIKNDEKLLANFSAYGGNLNTFRGNMSTNGADFSTGLMEINNGGIHEENPYEGVPMGSDQNGTPNLVEEGETIWNDYVFSNRLTVPSDFKKKYKLGNKKRLSFADASKKLAKESSERPNDPISKAGMDIVMEELAALQEDTKFKQQLKNPEFRRMLMQQMQQQVMQQQQAMQQQGQPTEEEIAAAQAQQQPTEEELMQQQMMQQYPQEDIPQEDMMGEGVPQEATEAQQGYAYGGHLYGIGDILRKTTKKLQESKFDPSKDTTKYVPYDRNMSLDDVRKLEQQALFKQVTDAANRYFDNPNNADPAVSEYLQALDAAAGGNHLFDKNGALLPTAKAFYNRARTSGPMGYYHITEGINDPVGPAAPTEGYRPSSRYYNNPIHFNTVKPYDTGFRLDPRNQDAIEGDNYRLIKNVNGVNGSSISYYGLPNDGSNNGNSNSEDDKLPRYQTWTRYAPLAGAAIGLGLNLGKPDYSNADAMIEAAYDAGRYMPIGFKPIGDYMTYKPFDRNYYINRARNTAAASRNALVNQANGNRATAAAGILASDYNTTRSIGELARQGEEYNRNLEKTVAEFNKDTNKYNSTGLFNADSANQDAYSKAKNAKLSGLAQGYALRQKIKDNRDAAISANLTNLFDSLGDIGWENWNVNQRNTNIEKVGRPGSKDYAVGTRTTAAGARTNSKGGKLNKRRRGLTY